MSVKRRVPKRVGGTEDGVIGSTVLDKMSKGTNKGETGDYGKFFKIVKMKSNNR